MKFTDKLETRFRFLDIPNVALFIVLGQVLAYGLILAGRASLGSLALIPADILGEGQYWRLLTCIVCPPGVPTSPLSIVFLAFFWYIFWFTSGALESEWGTVRFNLYLLGTYLFQTAFAFLGHWISPTPEVAASPEFFYVSVFLAFATRNPNIEFLVMFVIPVKVKWLGWLMGGFTFLAVLGAPSFGYRLAILGSVAVYLCCFAPGLIRQFKTGQRRASFENEARRGASEAFHTCAECGVTDQSDPEREFRYKTRDGDLVCLCDVCRKEGS